MNIFSRLLLPFLLFPLVCYAQQDIAALDKTIRELNAKKEYKAIIPLLEKRADIALQAGEDTTYLTRLAQLGQQYEKIKNGANAAKTYQKAIDFAKQKGLTQRVEYAKSLETMADLLKKEGQYSEALPYCTEAYTLLKKLKHPELNTVLSDLAFLYRQTGMFEVSETMYLELKELISKQFGQEHIKYAFFANSLAGLYKDLKRYEEAKNLYLQSLEIRRKILGENHADYAKQLNNLALLYTHIGKYEEAENYYLLIIEFHRKIGVENESHLAIALINLGLLYQKIDKPEKAEKAIVEGAELLLKIHGKAHPQYASALNSLGLTYYHLKKYKLAEENYKLSIDITKKSLGEQHPKHVLYLNNLAKLYYVMDNFEDAKGCFEQALRYNSRCELPPADIDDVWCNAMLTCEFISAHNALSTLRAMFLMYQQQEGQDAREKAYKICRLALALSEQIRHEFSEEENKLKVLADNNFWVAATIESSYNLEKIAPKSFSSADAFQYAELNKSILLTDAMKAQQARSLSNLPDSVIKKEQNLQKEIIDTKKKLLGKIPKETENKLQGKLTDLQIQADKFKKELETRYPKYYKLKYAPIETKREQLQALLDENTLLLEFFVADTMLYLFSMDKSDIELQRIAISKKALSEKTKVFRQSLSDYEFLKKNPEEALKQYVSSAAWFYEKLLAKTLSSKKHIQKLLIIPDDNLGHLPFEAFLVEEPKEGQDYPDFHYLLNDYKVSYNYSAALWKENLQTPNTKNNGRMLAMSASYQGKKDSTALRANRAPHLRNLRDALQDLPAAKEEVMGLSKFFSGTFLYANDANESEFKSKSKDFAIIHLAMHGILNAQYPILSSLAFTEDGDSVEDNFLQACEISQLQLNADLVVLSACETGYGKFQQGEGVMSLARSFMYAGVPSLVVSMWQVNDQSTSLIMQAFYKNLAGGMDKAEALRQAKLLYVKTIHESSQQGSIAAHPAFWAPFVQLGDSRPIHVEGIHEFLLQGQGWWWIGGGALLLLAGGGALALRRSRSAR